MSELEHFDRELYAIEERIERFAIACGIDLHDSTQLAAVTKGNFSLCTQGDDDSHRMLQDLVLLRQYVTRHCVDERGFDACRKMIDEVAERLRQHGFGG